MNRILIALAFVAIAAALPRHQGSDPRTAAILSEQRYLTGDGTFGTQYKQEDGVEFKEESDQYGNRKGSYSYVDANGQTKTVHYTAGKDGFHATDSDCDLSVLLLEFIHALNIKDLRRRCQCFLCFF
ncbi:Cuticular protein 100A [Carabus blaptoides fortunei]